MRILRRIKKTQCNGRGFARNNEGSIGYGGRDAGSTIKKIQGIGLSV